MNEKILKLLKQHPVTFFVGAGISMIPPSCLPSWWQINHIILDAMRDESASLVPEVKHLADLIKNREKEGKLPPEFVAETITNRIGESYFQVLQGLEGDTPNQVHLWLATLAKAGLLRAIVTTNFDTLVEQAFQMTGTPLQVCVDPEDMKKLDFSRDLKKDSPSTLLKLHGTATRPETCIDTLAQRKRGLHPMVLKALRDLGLKSFWIFMGYSGADLEADPNYLGIRGRAADSPGFAWLNLPGSQPLSVVSSLASLYGPERGILESGALPAWLEGLEEMLPPSIHPPKMADFSPEKLEKMKGEKTRQVTIHAQNWAKNRGTAECAITLSDIATSAGYYQDAKTVLLKIMGNAPQGELSPFGLGILYQELADLSRHFGQNREALDYYQKAILHYRTAGHQEGMLHSLQGAATIQERLGYYPQAEKLLQECLKYTREGKDKEVYAHALVDMASFYREMGKFKNGLATLEEALPLAVQLGLELLRAHILLGMSTLQNGLGKLEEAEKLAQSANEVYSRLGDDRFLSESFRHLSQLYFKWGNIEKAFQFLEQAREKAARVGNTSRMIRAEELKGDFLIQLGHYGEGEVILRNAARAAETLGEQDFLLTIWQNLGLSLQMQGKVGEARGIYQKALSKAQEVGLEIKIAGLRSNLGIMAEQQGDIEEALEHYRAADKIFQEMGLLVSVASSQGNIANIYYRTGNFEESKKYYQKALEIFEKLKDIDGILRTRYNMANIIYQSGNIQSAKGYYEQSIRIAEESGQKALRDYFWINYGAVLFKLEDYSGALELYLKAYQSCMDRKDYLQAGTASYYAGLSYLKKGDQQKAILSVESAVSALRKLEDVPYLLGDAYKLLQSLKV